MLVAGSGRIEDPVEIDAWRKIIEGKKINIFFFGSRNWTEWNNERFWGSAGHDLRRDVETKCREWTRDIVRNISPSKILCEGFAAFDRLCEMFDAIAGEEHAFVRAGRRNQRLFSRNNLKIGGAVVPILGILHPTGGRGRTREETIALGKEIISFCKSD